MLFEGRWFAGALVVAGFGVAGCGDLAAASKGEASYKKTGSESDSDTQIAPQALGATAAASAAARADGEAEMAAPAEKRYGLGVRGPGGLARGRDQGLMDNAKPAATGYAKPISQPEFDVPARPPVIDAPMDPNGRFATTYRPGGGHLAAFESAVSVGLVPAAEREVVGDVGARYVPEIASPKSGALAFQTDLERAKVGPTGGPVHLRFTLRSTEAESKGRPPVSVVVVLDTSGSMRGELIRSARLAAQSLVDKLEPSDDFSLVTFASEARVLIPMGKIGDRKDALKKTIGEIQEGGGTNIGGGLSLGYSELKKSKQADAVRVAMLLSDGRATEGVTNRSLLSKQALDAFQDGVQTSSFGLGTDYDGPLMSQIANDGAGGYYYLKSGEQIAAALSTELDKRLDPVASAVEIRVRLKPGTELLDVYGSRRLGSEEAARIRTIEIAQDKQAEKRDKIKANRQNDDEGGLRFFIPAFARDDAHTMLFKLRLPESVASKDIATIELKYKDRITKKNVVEEMVVKADYAASDAESIRTTNMSVQRTVQGFLAGQTLMQASRLVAEGHKEKAASLLAEREELLAQATLTLSEPLFMRDVKRLARLRNHIDAKGQLGEPLVLAMMMETAGNVHLH
ncbi:MAG: VWA domain-containing protein [Myxococcales bacterium]|nr:VWA domain-containing protein [Myxococcales bacterium]